MKVGKRRKCLGQAAHAVGEWLLGSCDRPAPVWKCWVVHSERMCRLENEVGGVGLHLVNTTERGTATANKSSHKLARDMFTT